MKMKMKMKISIVVASLALAAGVTACNSKTPPQQRKPEPAATPPSNKLQLIQVVEKKTAPRVAVAALQPKSGSKVTGTVTFTPLPGGGVKVTGDVKGLKPGKHGFHIHERGDCSGRNAKAAGGHFNPTHVAHGAPHSPVHHIGDLGNIVAGKDGQARVNATFKFLSLAGPNSIVGRSIIVHRNADDLHSQPSGNAGARVACGVIKRKPKPAPHAAAAGKPAK